MENSVVSVRFSWWDSQASARSVRLTGDMFRWGGGVEMERAAAAPGSAAAGKLWTATLTLPLGATVLYKFVVDGLWVYDSAQPFCADDCGHINTVLEVSSALAEGAEPAEPPAVAPAPGGSAAPSPVMGEGARPVMLRFRRDQ